MPPASSGASGESWRRPSYGERNGSNRTVTPPPRAAKLAWPNHDSAASPSRRSTFVRRWIEVSVIASAPYPRRSRTGRGDHVARAPVEDVNVGGRDRQAHPFPRRRAERGLELRRDLGAIARQQRQHLVVARR